MDFSNFWWQAAGGPGPGPEGIDNSLRFRGAQFLERTVQTSSPVQTPFTISFWIKRGRIAGGTANGATSTWEYIFNAFQYQGMAQGDFIALMDNDRFSVQKNGGFGLINAEERFRDPGGWYHLVWALGNIDDTPNGGRFYVNNVQLPNSSTNYGWNQCGSQTANCKIRIGDSVPGNSAEGLNFEGYIADFYAVDGQFLLPTAFGRENDEGVWVPREVDFTSAEMRPSDYLFSMPWSATPDVAEFPDYYIKRSFNASQPAERAFDGLIAGNNFAQANGGMVWRPGTQPEGVTRIVVRGRRITNAWLNGTKLTFSSVDNADLEIYNGAAVDLTTLAIFSGSSSFPSDLERIQLEQGGVLTTVLNPFQWSAGLTTNGTWDNLADLGDAFTGTVDENVAAKIQGNTTGSIVWTPPDPIQFTNTVEVWSNSDALLFFSDDPNPVATANNSWQTIATGGGTLTSIGLAHNTNAVWLNAVRIDGQIYKDGSNPSYGVNGFHLDFSDPDDLGADRSGNGNDFTPTGFDTAPVGIFSQYLTSPGGFQPGRPPSEAFTITSPNGTFAMANKGSTLTWEPPGGIPYTNGYQVFANDADLWVNDVEKRRMTSADPIFFEAGSGTIEKLELRAQSIDFPQLSYILLNGGSRQDPTPQPPSQNGIYLADNTGVRLRPDAGLADAELVNL